MGWSVAQSSKDSGKPAFVNLGLLTSQRAALRGTKSLYCRQVKNEIAPVGASQVGWALACRGPEGSRWQTEEGGGSKWLLELR